MEADHREQARSAIKHWISKNMCLVWGDSTVWWEADLDSNSASAAYSKTTPQTLGPLQYPSPGIHLSKPGPQESVFPSPPHLFPTILRAMKLFSKYLTT